MFSYACKVIIFAFVATYAVNFFGKSFLKTFEIPHSGRSGTTEFDPFTGLSHGRVSGSSGKRFKDQQCRKYSGTLTIPEKETPLTTRKGEGMKRCKMWVVITSINPPTATMRALAKIDDWCMVIVFDTKTPEAAYNELISERLIIFTVQDQIEFLNDYNLLSGQLIPWKHFGRKNLGFLFAIAHGAEWIYDTDDDNEPLSLDLPLDSPLLEMDINKGTTNPQRTSNIYKKFTDAWIWPRGFPLEHLHQEESFHCCRRRSKPVWVRQFLAQHDPDVDAIYRLTSTLPINFNTTRTGLVIPDGTYVPYNAQATLHSKEAFFGLLLPITVHGRVSDIWRSYFSQRLFSLAGASLAFLPPLVKQDRNVHDYLADLDSEVPLYMKAGQLVDFLSSWSPPPHLSSEQIVTQLAVDLYEHCYWEEGDVELVKAWLADLKTLGHSLPDFDSQLKSPGQCVEIIC